MAGKVQADRVHPPVQVEALTLPHTATPAGAVNEDYVSATGRQPARAVRKWRDLPSTVAIGIETILPYSRFSFAPWPAPQHEAPFSAPADNGLGEFGANST